ncbi:MAG TPA: response regulator transcription factor [Candidatus Limnocylindria bacterium]|nr:response regulator transcription factor [Candidatus Limnocylindria bacterium]
MLLSFPSVPGSQPRRPRVLIADADRRVRQSLSELLRVEGHLDVVGAAGSVREALELIERSAPNVLIVDPRLPDLDAGLALLRAVQGAWPSLRIVTMGWSDPREEPAMLGVSAYLPKDADPEELVRAACTACA